MKCRQNHDIFLCTKDRFDNPSNRPAAPDAARHLGDDKMREFQIGVPLAVPGQ